MSAPIDIAREVLATLRGTGLMSIPPRDPVEAAAWHERHPLWAVYAARATADGPCRCSHTKAQHRTWRDTLGDCTAPGCTCQCWYP